MMKRFELVYNQLNVPTQKNKKKYLLSTIYHIQCVCRKLVVRGEQLSFGWKNPEYNICLSIIRIIYKSVQYPRILIWHGWPPRSNVPIVTYSNVFFIVYSIVIHYSDYLYEIIVLLTLTGWKLAYLNVWNPIIF